MVLALHLPERVQDALRQKYDAATPTRPLTRSSSFERDVQIVCDDAPPDVETIRAIVCISDQMPPRPILGIARNRPRDLLRLTAGDADLTAVTAEAIPGALVSLTRRMPIPRSAVTFEGRGRYRARSVLDASTTLCIASDSHVANVVVAMSIVDEHIPASHLTNALREFMHDSRLLKRWLASVDPESITCPN